MPLTGLLLDMRALSLPAELQAYEGWMTNMPDVPPAPEQLPDADMLTRTWCVFPKTSKNRKFST